MSRPDENAARAIIKNLTYFHAVAHERHFRRAAQSLNITQSALSRRIQAMEAALETSLFERGLSSSAITPTGEVLYTAAADILFELENCARRLGAAKTEDTLIIDQNACVLPDVLRLLDQLCEHGRSAIAPRQMFLLDPKANIVEGEKEVFVIAHDGSFKPGRAHRTKCIFEGEPVGIAMSRAHRLADRALITAADIEAEPFIWPPITSFPQWCHHFDEFLTASRTAVRSIAEAPSLAAASAMTRSGIGISLLPLSMAEEGLQIVKLTGFPCFIQVELVRHPAIDPPWLRSLGTLVDMNSSKLPTEQAAK